MKITPSQNMVFSLPGGYTSIDPVSIDYPCVTKGKMTDADYANAEKDSVLNLLPNLTMRYAIRDVSAGATFSPVVKTAKGEQYQVVVDYTQSTTLLLPLEGDTRKPSSPANPGSFFWNTPTSPQKTVPRNLMLPSEEKDKANESNPGSANSSPATTQASSQESFSVEPALSKQPIPVYVGIGVRVTANLISDDVDVDISSLAAINLAVQQHYLHGTLVIQTLGISGEGVADAVPIPSELSTESVQSALTAIGSMKAKISNPNIRCVPQVLAIHNTDKYADSELNDILLRILIATGLPCNDPEKLAIKPRVCCSYDEAPDTQPSSTQPVPATSPTPTN